MYILLHLIHCLVKLSYLRQILLVDFKVAVSLVRTSGISAIGCEFQTARAWRLSLKLN